MKSFLCKERFGKGVCRLVLPLLLAQASMAQAQPCDYAPNAPIILTASGGNNGAGFSTRYALTDSGGMILQLATNTPSFSGQLAGSYWAYGINYKTATGINNLALGQNISAVTGPCVAVSAGVVVLVC